MRHLDQTASSRPITRRRTETQNKLMDAAFQLFAENGFGKTTVEQICDRAGFTRGAFYSNFDSLDELFLAMWSRNTEKLIVKFQELITTHPYQNISTTEELLHYLTNLGTHLPVGTQWYRVSLEFIAQSLCNPDLRREILAREQEILNLIVPELIAALNRVGRTIHDIEDFSQTLHTIHHGTMMLCLMHPGEQQYYDNRTRLFIKTIFYYAQKTS